MYAQGYLTRTIYEQSLDQPLPNPGEIQAPQEQTVEGVDAGYFTSWVQQQVIERYGAPRAFDGGLHIKTTLDLGLQRAAEQAIEGYLAYSGDPSASLVAIENSTGEVRAMVGGRSYDESPFNLATEGERQPGSSFKAFDLAAALQDGISPESVWTSKQKEFIVPNTGGHEKFVVHNDEGAYVGERTLTNALAYSDNSVFAEVGLRVGTHRIADLAHRMGITTPISTNPAMTIGGLHVGVTPLDMAHAYETIAHGGQRVSGTLAEDDAPVGIQEVVSPSSPLPDGSHRDVNQVQTKPVLPPGVAATETEMLETVLQYGTARGAALGEFAAGKTGTTSNYVDAWFVGWNHKYTVAVWVGYPEGARAMSTDYDGGPVLGGTFPALIWHNFMTSAMQIDKTRSEEAAAAAAARPGGKTKGTTSGTSSGEEPVPSVGGSPGTAALLKKRPNTMRARTPARVVALPAMVGERTNTEPPRPHPPLLRQNPHPRLHPLRPRRKARRRRKPAGAARGRAGIPKQRVGSARRGRQTHVSGVCMSIFSLVMLWYTRTTKDIQSRTHFRQDMDTLRGRGLET